MTVAKTIRKLIEALPPGEVFAPARFLNLGSRAAIDQTLSRLARAGIITRIARGIYVRPRHSRIAGPVLPSPAEVARGYAALRGLTIQPHGAVAARRFGLTTQVPAHPTYYTSGPAATLRLNRLEVRLEHSRPTRLLLAGRLAGVALSALLYLGRREATPRVVRSVLGQLPPEERAVLVRATRSLPGWLARPVSAFA